MCSTRRADVRRLGCRQGDIFVVPSWMWHSHENTMSDDAILFSISDRPATEALALYREEGE